MDKMSSVEKQIEFLGKQGLIISEGFESFLKNVPYQKSVNQLKVFYSDSKEDYTSNTCFAGKKSDELVKDYNTLWKDSNNLLYNILEFENRIKNKLFFIILTIYKEDKNRYKAIIDSIILVTNEASKIVFKTCHGELKANESGLDDLEYLELKNKYENKIYKVINACSMGELREIINLILNEEEYYKEVYEFMREIVPSSQEKKIIDSSVKEVLGKEFTMGNYASFKGNDKIEKMICEEFENIILLATRGNKYPIDILTEDKTKIVSLLSYSKIKKFFNDNQETLKNIKNDIDDTKKTKELKEQIQGNNKIAELALSLFSVNNEEYVKATLKALSGKNKDTKIDQIKYRDKFKELYEKEYKSLIVIKLFAMISSFRNLISHGNTLLIILKNGKEKIYIEAILKELGSDLEVEKYITILYKR